MIPQRKTGRAVFLLLASILAFGLLARMDVFLAKLHDFNIVGDAKNYLIMSRQIVDNGIYGYALGHPSVHPNAYVTPGYPLLLSAVYAIFHHQYLQVTALRFLQVLIGGVISPLLAFLFVRRLFKRSSIALLSALFTAIYPTYIISSVYILTEVTSLAAMLLYFYLQTISLQEKNRVAGIFAGLAFALNILIRPTMFPLFILPFIFAFFSWKKTDRAGLVKLFSYAACGALVLMLPWWARNYITMHKFILLSTGSGDPLLAGTYPNMTGLFQDYLNEKVRVSEAAYAQKRIIDGFLNEPLLYLKWYTVGKLGFLFNMPWLYWQASSSVIGWGMYKIHVILHYLLIRAGIIGVIAGALKKSVLLLTNTYALAFLSLLLIFVPEIRYSYHIMFFLMLSSSYAICYAAGLLIKLMNKLLLRYRQMKPV